MISKCLNPEWNQSFDFMVEDALHDMLLVDVFDHDTFLEVRWLKCGYVLFISMLNMFLYLALYSRFVHPFVIL